MAHWSPHKQPSNSADSYSMVSLLDQELVSSLLLGLSIATCYPISSKETNIGKSELEPLQECKDDGERLFTISSRMSCSCCATIFNHHTEQKAHFKSDWHHYNLKQELKGNMSISEDQFETVIGDVSSISGSGDTSTSSSDEDATSEKSIPSPAYLKKTHMNNCTDGDSKDMTAEMASIRRHPKVYLRNQNGQLLSLYRCVLYHKKESPRTSSQLLSLAARANQYTQIAVILLAGGHFSAVIFDGTEAILHKTFHRYVVRAKRGTVQSVQDKKGTAPRSGGASLRRYNEAALVQEIQGLLTSWLPQLKFCHLIFLRASTQSRHIFFGGKSPIFSKDDMHIRTIPFTTGRPTFNEARRVHHVLMTVECFGDESLAVGFVPLSPPRHLHPDASQLVAMLESSHALTSQNMNVKIKKLSKGENAERSKEPSLGGEENDGMAAVDIDVVDAEKGREDETELVEVTTEIRTKDLQEFVCCVDETKQHKKKTRKKNKKAMAGKTTPVNCGRRNAADLSEEDTLIKNKLYTCCRSGDAALLSQLIAELLPRQHNQQYYITGKCKKEKDKLSENIHIQDKERHVIGTGSVHSGHLAEPGSVLSEHLAELGSMHSEHLAEPGSMHSGHLAEPGSVLSEHLAEPSCENIADGQIDGRDCIIQAQNMKVAKLDEITCNLSVESLVNRSDSENTKTLSSNSGITTKPCKENYDTTDTKTGDVSKTPLKLQERFQHLVLGTYGSKEFSLLHIAASAGHGDVITVLLNAGCDPTHRDGSGKTAYSMALDKNTRDTFRRFWGSHPDRYDYDASEIPSALTADNEVERKQKEVEKRKEKKKVKQDRLKVHMWLLCAHANSDRECVLCIIANDLAEGYGSKEKKAEEREKLRFLALSDKEKLAQAVERRLLEQNSLGSVSPVLKRCNQCDLDICGKVPFEYMHFKFCTPKCLKEHRIKNSN